MRRVLVFAAFAALVVVPWAGALGPPTISVERRGDERRRRLVQEQRDRHVDDQRQRRDDPERHRLSERDDLERGRPRGTELLRADDRRLRVHRDGADQDRLDEPDDHRASVSRVVPIRRAGTTRRSASPRRRLMQSPGRGRVAARTPVPTARPPPAASPASTWPGTARRRRPLAFQFDDTPPTISSAAAARAPDKNGWYNHAVVVNFTATDNLSGPGPCTPVSYAGPDGAGAAVPSSCTDVAGNASTGSAIDQLRRHPSLRWGLP